MNTLKTRPEHLATQEKDAARFVWWFGKRNMISLNSWRRHIDAAMQDEDQAEDAALHSQLVASIEARGRHSNP